MSIIKIELVGVLGDVIASMEKDKLKHAICLADLEDEERMYYEGLDKVDEFGRVV